MDELQFNASKYNEDDDISKKPRQQLQNFLNNFKEIFTRSLDSYNKSAEIYIESMVRFLKEKSFYNDTEMELKHQSTRNIAIRSLKCEDDGLQTRLNAKIETYIGNKFNEFKARNEESRRIMTAVCVNGENVSSRLVFVSSLNLIFFFLIYRVAEMWQSLPVLSLLYWSSSSLFFIFIKKNSYKKHLDDDK